MNRMIDRASEWAARQVSRRHWNETVAVLIVLNAVVIGLTTYPQPPTLSRVLDTVDGVFLGIFVVEQLIRLAAARFNLPKYLKDPWNAFDFSVVVASLLPMVSTSSLVLRLVRLLRVSRLLRFMPDVQVLLRGMHRAAGPAVSLLGLTTLLVYLYAVMGWLMFSGRTPPDMPQYFENVGESMLTLFELLTLEGWNSTMRDLRDLHPLALPFVISFLLIGTYVVANLVIGVIINSLDGAYEERRLAVLREEGDTPEVTLQELKDLIRKLEAQITTDLPEVESSPRPTERPRQESNLRATD